MRYSSYHSSSSMKFASRFRLNYSIAQLHSSITTSMDWVGHRDENLPLNDVMWNKLGVKLLCFSEIMTYVSM